MIVHDVIQGSPQWLALRAGMPTASQFHKVITPKKGDRSAQMMGYCYSLVAERILGRPLATPEMPWMTEGTDRGPEAAAYYEMATGVEVQRVGFITNDDGTIGCSPDRLAGDGLLELKCPQVHTHIGYLLGEGPADDYRVQLQGQLYVSEKPWVDICSYYPGLPERVIRVGRDEQFIAKLSAILVELVEHIDWCMRKLAALGCEPKPPLSVVTQEIPDWLGVSQEDVDAIFGVKKENIP